MKVMNRAVLCVYNRLGHGYIRKQSFGAAYKHNCIRIYSHLEAVTTLCGRNESKTNQILRRQCASWMRPYECAFCTFALPHTDDLQGRTVLTIESHGIMEDEFSNLMAKSCRSWRRLDLVAGQDVGYNDVTLFLVNEPAMVVVGVVVVVPTMKIDT